MDLLSLLQLAAAGGLSGSITYLMLKYWPWYKDLADAELKRWIAFAANAVVAVAAWFAMLGMGWVEAPVGKAWIETIANIVLALGSTSYVTSQAWHGRELKRKT